MNICFHIGFPKSASTTLQKHLFDKHSQINFLGIYPTSNIGQDSSFINSKTLFLRDKNLQIFHNRMTECEGIEYFNQDKDKLIKSINSLLDKNKLNLFSNERFSSVLFAHPDRAQKAQNIKQIFPNAKILIVIRNQIDIIKSQYRDHPFDPRCLTLGKPVSIEEWIDINISMKNINFFKSIKYSEIINYYIYLFGESNVKVVLFEDLINDLEYFSKEISLFLGIDSNETFSLLNGKKENIGVPLSLNKYRQFKRRISTFIPKKLKQNIAVRKIDNILFSKLKYGKKQKICINNDYKNKIYEYYYFDNLKLIELGIDIKNKGYLNE